MTIWKYVIKDVSTSGPTKEENNMKHNNLQISLRRAFKFFFNWRDEEDEIVNFHFQVSSKFLASL